MAANFDDILSAALSLSPSARAMLADHLLQSFDDKEEKRIEAIWAEEAERRAQAIDEGRVTLIPGEQVMSELRARRKEDCLRKAEEMRRSLEGRGHSDREHYARKNPSHS